MRPAGALLVCALAAIGCSQASAERREPAPLETAAVASPSPSAVATARPSATAPAAKAAAAGACPEKMALVEGTHCPTVEHVCLEHQKRLARGWVDGQCARYKPPALCHGERAPLRFCIDKWEWPNEQGALPRTLVSWTEAKASCEGLGKRLCDEREWTRACEGEDAKPHVHGWERDGALCNYDKPYRERTYNYKPHDACLLDPACKAEYERLDQRVPAGSLPGCVSAEGVHDLNGNVNEWVMRPEQPFAKRSGLKGGWWGPVRDRCRPMTTFHGESDYGYEVGFRCCKDAARASPGAKT